MSAGAGRSPAVSGGGARPAGGPRRGARPAAGAGAAARPAAGAGAAATGAGDGRSGRCCRRRPTFCRTSEQLPRRAGSFHWRCRGSTSRRRRRSRLFARRRRGRSGTASGQTRRRRSGRCQTGRCCRYGRRGAHQNLSNNRAGRVENRQELQGNRQQRRDEVRNQVAENHPRLDFWSDHPGWAAWRINRPYRWATWAALGGWIGYGAGEPTSYAYGENVYYEGDQVYYGDQAVATADQYAEQADAIAAGAPQTKPESSEWLPLGVFALTQDGQASGVEPTLFMQLAISKEGVIAGTFKNMATDQVQTLEGMADKKSQRVAWCVAGQKRPIIETGISNLTQDTSPALIHFADGQTQQWLLVRLPEPKQG